MKASTIFKDRTKLLPSYLPKDLPHREKQVANLLDFFSDSIREIPSPTFRTYQIVGEVGSGKTVTALRFSERLESQAKDKKISVSHAYLNPKQHGLTKQIIFRHLVQQVDPGILSLNYSAEELMFQLLMYLNNKNRYLVIIFDEVDYFVQNSKDSVVYSLTRLNEVLPGKSCNVLGVVFTARSAKYHEKLDRAELSTLGRLYTKFEPYSAKQAYDILEGRVEIAFKLGTVSSDVLRFVADVTADRPASGDLRYGLELLLRAGSNAEFEGAERLSSEHVRRAITEVSPSIREEDIVYLQDEERGVLFAIVNGLRGKKEPYLGFDEIVTEYGEAEKERAFKKLELKQIVDYVHDLSYRGLVDVRSLREIGISAAPVESLDRFLENLANRLLGEKASGEEKQETAL